MKNLVYILLFICFSIKAQQKIKVKREDNRFLFFQLNQSNDTIIKNKTDLFFIKFPDSLKTVLQVNVYNAQISIINNDSTFKLVPVIGMKYSLKNIENSYKTFVEGICEKSNTIIIDFVNIKTGQKILTNSYHIKQ